MDLWNTRWLGIPYHPRPDERPYLDRAQVRQDDELIVRAAVLDKRESERFFGVPLARRGVQPVWLEITNGGAQPYRLRLASLDANYYPPLEAAFVNHFRLVRRLVAFGVLAWFFLPLLVLLPFKLLAARAANRRMNAFFQEHGIGWGPIKPGATLSGFVFTSLDEGTKQFSVRLLGPAGAKAFAFSIPVPGLRVDHRSKQLDELGSSGEVVDCDEGELRKRLAALPRSTANRRGTRQGDPLNLVAIGDFDTIINGFGARWDETETISLSSCWRTFKAFSLGSEYRYSPVSSLYVDGRCQDFALQKARETINERLHLRLWITPLRFQGRPVWVGQISRDIGVRFTLKTWNLTTHKIDPDVDDARDYLLDVLLEGGHVALVAYVAGAEAAGRTTPRHNLTGDPYFTDGLRAVAIFSESRTPPTLANWA
ncbi:MAG TPA: LssY C-terminal domain-containing protein [Gemmataceae bacterium]|nr:LssY C-terminal domain-containing protein [Gemmataceae bacterium]